MNYLGSALMLYSITRGIKMWETKLDYIYEIDEK